MLTVETPQDHDLDSVFVALANEHRREIIRLLSLQPSSISRLAALRGLSLPAIHKHIKTLEHADMVVRKKLGRTNFLALNRRPLSGLRGWVEQFHPYWGSKEETLDNYAEYLSKQPDPEEEST